MLEFAHGCVTLVSWAKVNLGLRILGHRPDGFHEIETVIQSVGVGDIVRVRMVSHGENRVSFRGQEEGTPWAIPLLSLMDQVLPKTGGQGHCIEVEIDKRIPVAAGLGGSSADAAGLLRALMVLSGEENLLQEMAPSFGSDIAAMLRGGRTRCRGRGERVTPLSVSGEEWYAILLPPVQCNTGGMYEAVEHGDICEPCEQDSGYSLNDFEPVVRSKYLEVDQAFRAFNSVGVEPGLSGSGSAVFAVSKDRSEAKQLLSAARKETGFKGLLCPAMPRGFEIIAEEWGVAKR